MLDRAELQEVSRIASGTDIHDTFRWRCVTDLRKFHGDSVHESDLYDHINIEGNLLMIGGASALWERLINGATTVTVFSNANAMIGVGDSSTASTAVMTDLQATTNKFRKAMDATYPTHTDGTGTGSGFESVVFRSTFATGDANYAWNEWGIFNGSATTGAAAGGRMLNRRVEALGTKTSSATWQLTLTLSLAGGA